MYRIKIKESWDEDNYIKNGLGSAISQLICNNYPILIKNIGVEKYAESGLPSELSNKYKIDSQSIVKATKQIVKEK